MARPKKATKPKKKPPKKLTPAEEEAKARKREAALEKARIARLAKLKAERDEKVWAVIQPMKARRGCKCRFRKGWTWEQLRKLNAGCTSGDGGLDSSGWVCPTLDAYRRYLENPELLK